MVQNLKDPDIKLPLCYFPLFEATHSSVKDKFIYSLTEKRRPVSLAARLLTPAQFHSQSSRGITSLRETWATDNVSKQLSC